MFMHGCLFRQAARQLPPTDVDALAPVVEEVQGFHAYRHGQRVPVVDGRVRRQPDREFGRAPVVPPSLW